MSGKKILKEIIGYLLMRIMSVSVFPKGNITSVYFHNPSVELFEKIVKWFVNRDYQFISVTELEAIIDSRIHTEKKVVITFDDGWKNNLKLIPVIEKYNIPIAVFIPTEPVISGNYWWEFASQPGQKKYSNVENVRQFKKLDRDTFFQKVGILKEHFSLKRSAVTLNELLEMNRNKLITLGSHTVNHPILINGDSASQESELSDSKTELEKWLGTEVKYLAYPNGDFNEETLKLVRKAGYSLCFTTEPSQIIVKNVNKYRVPRFSVNDHGGYYENISKSLGIWQKIF